MELTNFSQIKCIFDKLEEPSFYSEWAQKLQISGKDSFYGRL